MQRRRFEPRVCHSRPSTVTPSRPVAISNRAGVLTDATWTGYRQRGARSQFASSRATFHTSPHVVHRQ